MRSVRKKKTMVSLLTQNLEGKLAAAGLTIVVVIAHDNFLNLAKLAHFAPKVLIEGVKMVLQLARIHLDLGVVCRVLVEVGQEDGLRVRRLDVLARAPVAMPARANLVVEGTVDLVGFSAKDRGEIVGHSGAGASVSAWLLAIAGLAHRSADF